MEDPQKGIIEADGILCFNITRGKTKAAVRIVPVHHSMLDVVKELRSGARPLCRSASSVLYSQRFGDSKRRLGLPRTQSLHSLRATFITLAMQVENPELMVAQVAGHTSGQTMTGQLYHKGFTTAQLQAVVNSVPAFDYTGLVD
jgi:integrase